MLALGRVVGVGLRLRARVRLWLGLRVGLRLRLRARVGLRLRLRARVTCDGWLASSRSRSRSRAAARSRICWAVCMILSSRAASSVGPNLASSRSMRIDSVRKTSLYLWGRGRARRRGEHMHALTRCGRPLCSGGQVLQGSSEVLRGHQLVPEVKVIRGHQRSSRVLRGHQ